MFYYLLGSLVQTRALAATRVLFPEIVARRNYAFLHIALAFRRADVSVSDEVRALCAVYFAAFLDAGAAHALAAHLRWRGRLVGILQILRSKGCYNFNVKCSDVLLTKFQKVRPSSSLLL